MEKLQREKGGRVCTERERESWGRGERVILPMRGYL